MFADEVASRRTAGCTSIAEAEAGDGGVRESDILTGRGGPARRSWRATQG